MAKHIWIIFKKECSRFLKDKRMVFTIIILPALLMYFTYTLMGGLFNDYVEVETDHSFQCYVQNAPESYAPIFDSIGFEVIGTTDADSAKQAVSRKDADLVVLFPENFDTLFSEASQESAVPNIQVYYNSDSATSCTAYDLFEEASIAFETSMVNLWDINRDVENPDVATSSSLMITMLPMMVVITIFTSCAGFTPESIAGEKERGTIATLLVTPVRRSSIAIGKILSLSLFALLAGISNFSGILLGLPNLFPDEVGAFSMPAYSFAEYGWMLLVIVSAVLLTVSIMSIISAVSKSVKEATATATIVTGISFIAGLLPQFPLPFNSQIMHCIPVFNIALTLNDLFLLEYSVMNIVITCASNLVFTLALLWVLTRLFNSEKVMFQK